MRRYAWLLPAVLAAALLSSTVRADDEGSWAYSTAPSPDAACCWDQGTCSVEFLSGYYPMTSLGPSRLPFYLRDVPASSYVIDYVPLTLRLGYELPHLWSADTLFEGTLQALLEYDTLLVTRAFGSYFTGPSAVFRYNFGRPDAMLIPYLQGGAGIVFDDAYRRNDQRLIGRWQEFLLQAAGGVRVALTEQLSLAVEGGFQHISNARLAPRNGGINNVGALIGFTYTFGK
jgi:hypothetical protein